MKGRILFVFLRSCRKATRRIPVVVIGRTAGPAVTVDGRLRATGVVDVYEAAVAITTQSDTKVTSASTTATPVASGRTTVRTGTTRSTSAGSTGTTSESTSASRGVLSPPAAGSVSTGDRGTGRPSASSASTVELRTRAGLVGVISLTRGSVSSQSWIRVTGSATAPAVLTSSTVTSSAAIARYTKCA